MTRDGIFISYRRSDALGTTTAIRKTLLEHFGEDVVFRDVDGIKPGMEFPEALRAELQRAAVVIAVIGKGWLLAANEWGQRRIDFADDWVATELSAALSEPEVTVIPVLVDGASLPPAQALPPTLRGLSTRNAVALHHEAWDDSFQRLSAAVSKVLAPAVQALDPQATEAAAGLTPEMFRSLLAEALDPVTNVGDRALLSTVDDLSRMVATLDLGGLQSVEKATLKLLATRLFQRPVIRISAYMTALFPVTFPYRTDGGQWLGFAIEEEQAGPDRDFHRCVLLLPGPSTEGQMARVVGIAVVSDVNFDYRNAGFNDPPGADVFASGYVLQIGQRLSG